ncbi:hypothetical protein TAESTU_40203 [Tenacibaculum aestuarii]
MSCYNRCLKWFYEVFSSVKPKKEDQIGISYHFVKKHKKITNLLSSKF